MFRPPFRRNLQRALAAGASLGIALLTTMAVTSPASASSTPPSRPDGPCDLYAMTTAAGPATPCVAAHSTTRALYKDYHGPLYQVGRLSDGAVTDIGVVEPSNTPVPDPGGYADAAAQDAFCVNTTCLITTIYDQSPKHNDLTQAPRGIAAQNEGIKPGPAIGGQDNLPIANMAPITVDGHKAYGVFIEPGMGLRNNHTNGIAVDDEAEGLYMVADGTHYNNGCCFDYGNAEIDSRDDGNATMEAVYFGNRARVAPSHSYGQGNGPWVMSDQENTLVGCADPGTTYGQQGLCPPQYTPPQTSRFVTAVTKGSPGVLTNRAGDAQVANSLTTQNDGQRFDPTYNPMQKQGAIILGTGGDNSNASIGTFYEGVITQGYPADQVDENVQNNIAAVHYDVQRLSLAATNATDGPHEVQTFTPGSNEDVTETFTNTSRTGDTATRAVGLTLGLSVPAGWTSVVKGSTDTAASFAGVAPGATVSATFTVTAGATAFNGDLTGKAAWSNPAGVAQSETTTEQVRDTSPIKINEFRVSSSGNPSDAFIELYNGGGSATDLSGWTLTERPSQQAVSSTITIPAGTTLAAHGHYLLGLSDSGLAASAAINDSTVYLRDTTGLSPGDTIRIGSGLDAETATITNDSALIAASPSTPLWQPLPDGVITVPAGSTNVPVSSTAGFAVGQKLSIGFGNSIEIATVTQVGTPGTQARTTAAASAGDNFIEVTSTTNINPGDTIHFDIGARAEDITVQAVGTSSAGAPTLTLKNPLTFAHSANLPFSNRGSGISFSPATTFAHSSDEPVQALGSGVTLNSPLTKAHAIDAAVIDAAATGVGYQGSATPDQWFGGPVLGRTGSLLLRDAQGTVADSVNYGDLVDPWLAEGYQPLIPNPNPFFTSTNPALPPGCYAKTPPAGRSELRTTDGVDTDSNCNDFMSGPSTPGAPN